jgi:hypothetical protein
LGKSLFNNPQGQANSRTCPRCFSAGRILRGNARTQLDLRKQEGYYANARGLNFTCLTFEGPRPSPLESERGTPHNSVPSLLLDDDEDGEVFRACTGSPGKCRAASFPRRLATQIRQLKEGNCFRGGYALRQFIGSKSVKSRDFIGMKSGIVCCAECK